jgi:membrane protease YdiL (CAAX protease family)
MFSDRAVLAGTHNHRDDPVSPTVRRAFRNLIGLNVGTGVMLLVLFGVVRMALVLQANVTGSYSVVSLVFVVMAVLPWLVLTREGRRRVGIVRPARWRWMLPAALTGITCCLATFALVVLLWGESGSNPFVYIAGTYSAVPGELSAEDRLIYFVIFAVIAMLFSPIGEELLYRGFAHQSIAARLGDRRAAVLDAGAFALVHLAHFGIVYAAGAWSFLPLPAAVWVAAMFAVSLVFYGFRVLTGSVLGSVAAHAGFNVTMTFVIFYALDVL